MTKFLIVCALALNSAFAVANVQPGPYTDTSAVGYECENAYATRARRLEASAENYRHLGMGLTALGGAGVVYGVVKKYINDYTFMIPLFITAASAVATARYSVPAFEEEARFDRDISRAISEARAGQPGPATARLTNTMNAAIYHEGTREDKYLVSRMDANLVMQGELKTRLEYEKLSVGQVFKVVEDLSSKGQLCSVTGKPLILKKLAFNIFEGLLQTPGVLQP